MEPHVLNLQSLSGKVDALESNVTAGFGKANTRLSSIEDKLDKLILLMQTEAVAIAMNLSFEDSSRFRAAIQASTTGIGKQSLSGGIEESGTGTQRRLLHQVTEDSREVQLAADALKQASAKLEDEPHEPPSSSFVNVAAAQDTSSSVGADETDVTIKLEPEQWFPSWAKQNLDTCGEWCPIGPPHPVIQGAIVKVVETFMGDDDTGNPFFPGMKCHILKVDSDGDILVYCAEFCAAR
jgi:hypothetical protein